MTISKCWWKSGWWKHYYHPRSLFISNIKWKVDLILHTERCDASIKNYYTTFTVLQLPFYDCWLVAADPNCSSTQHWFWRTIWSSWWCWRHRKGRGCYYWLWYPLLCSARSCFFGVLIRLNGNDCRILNWLLMAQFFHHRTIFIWNSYIQCSDVQTRPFAPDILNNVDTVVGVVFRHSKCWIKYCSKTWFAWDRADRE